MRKRRLYLEDNCDPWEKVRRRPEHVVLKHGYDEATGHYVERVWQAAQALGIHYIDALHMMSAFRGPSGTEPVKPRPANFDPIRDAEPPPKPAPRTFKSPYKPQPKE
ncbi:MAG: hypothetical protein AB7S74_16125 [Hyphomicrobium sp.]